MKNTKRNRFTDQTGKSPRFIVNLILAVLGLAMPMLLLECGLRSTFTPDMSTSFDNTVYAVEAPPEMVDAFTWDGDGNSLAHIRSDNRIMVYELRPSTVLNEFIQINSHGFRDREFDKQKKPSVYRICVLGDSITFGWWEKLEETFPKVLENLLRKHGPTDRAIEVLNMGIGGYNAEQEAELLRTRVLDFEPDMLIVGFCINDYMYGADRGLWRHFSRSGSLAWDWVSLRIIQARFLFSRKTPIERAYEKMAAMAAERDIPLMVAFFHPSMNSDEARDYIQRHIRFSRSVGIVPVDLEPPFREYGWDKTMTDAIHPNALGHEIAAKTIYHAILQHGLIEGLTAEYE